MIIETPPPVPELSAPAISPVQARLQLAAIVESSDDAIISKDLHGIITSWNTAAARLFGYTSDEIVGKSVLLLIPPELQSEEPEILRKVTSGERIEHYETLRRRKNGEILNISLTISPIRNLSGRVVGISKIARDITERKQTEVALFESERLAAIGRMAASIAHEVNNPLEAILNISYLLSQNPSLDQEARDYTQILISEVVRVSEITKQTLSFYRETTSPVEIDMAALFESIFKLHGPILQQKSIRVFTNFRPAFIYARPGELRQVFTNLIINAVDALPFGGEIKVGVSQPPLCKAVCVTIADNGTGIPENVRHKIFHPFFTTKPSRGTGLGLWVSLGIVRKYGGTIRMRTASAPARKTGTIFRVCLPTHM
jgi:PAS domain S-box-containing protein